MAFLATGAELNNFPEIRKTMYRVRHEIFHDELGWDVNSRDGLEYDEYDTDDTVYILYEQQGSVIGTSRLLRTTGPYMLADTFPDLAKGYIPHAENVWELSRFSIDKKLVQSRDHFELISADMFCTLCEFCILYGVDEIVMVQEPRITHNSNEFFGMPHVWRPVEKFGKDDAQVCHYRPSFQQQLRQITERLNMRRPVNRSFDIYENQSLKLMAAE